MRYREVACFVLLQVSPSALLASSDNGAAYKADCVRSRRRCQKINIQCTAAMATGDYLD